MKYRMTAVLAGLATVLMLAGCAEATPQHTARIVASYPHDRHAFTQGLLIDHGTLYESTGLNGHSSLRRVDLTSGRVERSTTLGLHYFGEGLALAGDRLYQLTWKAGAAFVYDRDTLERVGQRRYAGQGWGLTWDGAHLIMSDGSAVLRVLDPADFSVQRRITVRENGTPVEKLNELEYVDGELWANVWYQDRILRIDPDTGRVIGVIDAANLRAALPADADPDVLNGIAWDAASDRLFVTGKNWPRLYEIARPGGLGVN